MASRIDQAVARIIEAIDEEVASLSLGEYDDVLEELEGEIDMRQQARTEEKRGN